MFWIRPESIKQIEGSKNNNFENWKVENMANKLIKNGH